MLVLALLAAAVTATAVAGDGDASGRSLAPEAEDIARAEALVNAGGDGTALAQARALLDGVLDRNPGSAAAHREYARIHMTEAYLGGDGRGEPEGLDMAGAALDRAVELDPRWS